MSSDDAKPHLPELPRAGDVIEGRYRLREAFASGGMGVVMKAEQIRTGREVAVKLLHPHIAAREDFAGRFKREVRVATLFDHPNIVRVYDVGETDKGALYLVMELLEGEELKDIIRREAPLSVGRAVDIALQMVDGLAEAHSEDIVHRDLKPANVFVGKTRRGKPRVKLLDFGMAKLANSGRSDLTATGVYAGTPPYIAPETMLQGGDADHPGVDVYAAGLVLLEMLTGKRVFEGEGVPQTLIQHLKKPVLLPESIDKTPLGDVIRGSTIKHPDDRITDGDELYSQLEDAAENTPSDLTVKHSEIPRSFSETSASLLEQLKPSDSQSLEMLESIPQHQTFSAGDERPSLPTLPKLDPETPTGETVPYQEIDPDAVELESDPPASFEAEPTRVVAEAQRRSKIEETDPTKVYEPEQPDPPGRETGSQNQSSRQSTAPSDSQSSPREEQTQLLNEPESGKGTVRAGLPSWTDRMGAAVRGRLLAGLRWLRSTAATIRERPARVLIAVGIVCAVAAVGVAGSVLFGGSDSPDDDGRAVAAETTEQPDQQEEDVGVPDESDGAESAAQTEDDDIDEEPEEAEQREVPAPVTARFESEPDEVEVFRDDRKLGTTPLELQFEVDELPPEVVFRKEGYRDQTEQLERPETSDGDDGPQLEVRASLERQPEPEPSPSASSQPTTRPDPRPEPDPESEPDPEPQQEESDDNVDTMLDQYLDD